jgi:hypothetical protein
MQRDRIPLIDSPGERSMKPGKGRRPALGAGRIAVSGRFGRRAKTAPRRRFDTVLTSAFHSAMDLRPARQDEALMASEWLVADIRATMSDPARLLVSPLDRIVAAMSDTHQVSEVQATIEQTDDRELQKSLQWFARGLALQHQRRSESDMSLSRTIKRATVAMQYVLLAAGYFLLLLGYSPQFDDGLVLAGYITMGSSLPATVIGTCIWNPVRRRAGEARLVSRTLYRITEFNEPRESDPPTLAMQSQRQRETTRMLEARTRIRRRPSYQRPE